MKYLLYTLFYLTIPNKYNMGKTVEIRINKTGEKKMRRWIFLIFFQCFFILFCELHTKFYSLDFGTLFIIINCKKLYLSFKLIVMLTCIILPGSVYPTLHNLDISKVRVNSEPSLFTNSFIIRWDSGKTKFYIEKNLLC